MDSWYLSKPLFYQGLAGGSWYQDKLEGTNEPSFKITGSILNVTAVEGRRASLICSVSMLQDRQVDKCWVSQKLEFALFSINRKEHNISFSKTKYNLQTFIVYLKSGERNLIIRNKTCRHRKV